MHILQLVPSLEVGGVERGVVDISRGLIARGHQVSVVSSGGPLAEALRRTGATHYELPVHKKSLFSMAACVPALASIIRTTGVDIVHARSRVPGWIGWVAALRTNRPFITTAHGFYSAQIGSRVMVWGRFVIAPSDSLGRYLIDTFNLPKARLRVIPRGVDLSEFQPQPPRKDAGPPWRIGMFGRLSEIKGHEVALRAVAALIRQGLPVKLCIAGDLPGSPQRNALAALAQSLKITDAVEWHGVRHDIPDLLASVDMVAVPSVYPESFGRAVVEAQAIGRPVVASRLGALAELVQDGQTGLSVPPGDADALANAIKRLIEDPALRERCVAAAQKRVLAEWSLDGMVDRTVSVYEECLTRPRIVVWKLSALGDVILAGPSLRAIRAHFTDSFISLVVGRKAYDVVARNPDVNEILLDPGESGPHGWRKRWQLIRRLKQDGFDLSIDLQNSRWTHIAPWLAGIPRRIGYKRKLAHLLTEPVPLPKQAMGPVPHQKHLLAAAGIPMKDERLKVWLTERESQSVDKLLQGKIRPDAKGMVGLHPGGSGRWKTKRWDIDRWAQLCDELAQRQLQVVITGGPDELDLAGELSRLAVSTPLMLIGQTSVLELAEVIRRCQVFVAHDSSPLHLASAVGTPTVAIFGPTDPRRHLPPAFTGQVIKKDVFCSPCYSPTCKTVTHACMKRIEASEVIAAVLGLLPRPCASST